MIMYAIENLSVIQPCLTLPQSGLPEGPLPLGLGAQPAHRIVILPRINLIMLHCVLASSVGSHSMLSVTTLMVQVVCFP